MAFLSYAKISSVIILCDGGKSSLIWIGIVTQIGSFIGGLVTFVVISVFGLLTSESPCYNYIYTDADSSGLLES